MQMLKQLISILVFALPIVLSCLKFIMKKIQTVLFAIMLAKNALAVMIIIALNVQKDIYKMQLIYLKTLKNVLRHVQLEQIYAMMEYV